MPKHAAAASAAVLLISVAANSPARAELLAGTWTGVITAATPGTATVGDTVGGTVLIDSSKLGITLDYPGQDVAAQVAAAEAVTITETYRGQTFAFTNIAASGSPAPGISTGGSVAFSTPSYDGDYAASISASTDTPLEIRQAKIGYAGSTQFFDLSSGFPPAASVSGSSGDLKNTGSFRLEQSSSPGDFFDNPTTIVDLEYQPTGLTLSPVGLPSAETGGSYSFSVPVTAGSTIFIDPAVATGYSYATGAGNPNFASVTLPAIQTDPFTVSFLDGGVTTRASVTPGAAYDFPTDGVAGFTVTGIDAADGLDPANPNAFVTGLSFEGDQNFTFTGTQTPIISNAVPEPASIAGLMVGLVGLCGAHRRRPGPRRPSAGEVARRQAG